VTARRVPVDAADDLVQDAMEIILKRGVQVGSFDTPDGLPPLVWCLQVLRNVIGNYYQRTRTLSRRGPVPLDEVSEPAAGPTPLAALESGDAVRTILDTIDTMGPRDADCARYLRTLIAGVSPAELARTEGVDPMALYKRLYRCRIKLRTILVRRGILP